MNQTWAPPYTIGVGWENITIDGVSLHIDREPTSFTSAVLTRIAAIVGTERLRRTSVIELTEGTADILAVLPDMKTHERVRVDMAAGTYTVEDR